MIVVYSPRPREIGKTYTDDCMIRGEVYQTTARFIRYATKEEYIQSIRERGGTPGPEEFRNPIHVGGRFYEIEVLD